LEKKEYFPSSLVCLQWRSAWSYWLPYLSFDEMSIKRIDDEKIFFYVDLFPNLIRIDLSYCSITDQAVQYIMEKLSSIKDIKLEYCQRITSKSIQYICSAGREIRSLNISQNYTISYTAFEYLEDISSTLKKLDISSNVIRNELYHILARCLGFLQILKMDGCGLHSLSGFSILMQNLSHLNHLSISNSNINDDFIFSIVQHFSNLTTLKILNISLNSITNLSIIHLAQLTSLKKLIANQCCNLTNDCLPFFQQYSNLKDLSLKPPPYQFNYTGLVQILLLTQLTDIEFGYVENNSFSYFIAEKIYSRHEKSI